MMKNLLDDMVDKCGLESCDVRKKEGETGNLLQCARFALCFFSRPRIISLFVDLSPLSDARPPYT